MGKNASSAPAIVEQILAVVLFFSPPGKRNRHDSIRTDPLLRWSVARFTADVEHKLQFNQRPNRQQASTSARLSR
ncbi:MAG TPA: hypothetical protein VK148_02385 [Xanthobacteraceae bacterium]|nr:hypothetical protein [Xanthobacteraceae bacterium]